MGLNKKFGADSVGEYEMENELRNFLSCDDTDFADVDRNIPMDLCEFYFKAIGKLLGRDERWSHAKNVRRFFYVLRPSTDSWCWFKYGCKEEYKLLEDTLYYRIACIYRNSTCISSAVAHHFETFLNRNWNIRSKLLKKKELRICSVGGGSPSDVVALVKVLESNVDEEDELDISVSIIGGNKKWQNTCLVVLMCFARFHNAIWKINFLQADFFQPFSDEVTNAIASADIVSMVKVFSGPERVMVFQRVHRLAQPGSVVYCLDSCHSHLMHACGGYLGHLPRHCLLYEAIGDLYKLDETVMKRHFELYDDEFPSHMCNTAFLVFCRVWLKNPTNLPVELHLKPVNDKFVKIYEHLLDVKKQEKELRRKFQLFFESEMCSFRTWKVSTDLEMRKMGRTKKQRKQVIQAVECNLRKELVSRRKLMNSLCSECTRNFHQGEKELFDRRKIFFFSKIDAGKVKLKIHQQSIKEWVKNFQSKCTASGEDESYNVS